MYSQKLSEGSCYSILWDNQLEILKVNFKIDSKILKNDFKKNFVSQIETIQSKKPKKVIIDNNQQQHKIIQDLQWWMNVQYAEVFHNSRTQKLAWIVSNDFLQKYILYNMITPEELEGFLKTQYFSKEFDAIEWLKL
ncbi:hypothetical protein [Flammeovirga kamogawensis]|uniref:STAS/SEC14 domain-containing protein n=1 Tax=Flammeovirga kamogawensis TaxID=373891 RepID=A0ABX8H274_9BACT|nr:hypothetical protein [Flammeovirga kamogawensis]MBB6460188.1 hypothetical protein [Flammeovirga kamogawensis]QWG10000.1 hypothetical protein KM029_20170 [Flammeovirga kamogawensis]TRX65508.1 hypothetical protein EO216_23600 [Flammeovirga kamogawensis]